MDAEQAIQICFEEFPRGLEALVETLSIVVEYESLNVDGWCFQTPEGRRHVRLSNRPPVTRQRFTLAHEVAHFVLKNEPGGLSVQKDIFDPKNPDEKAANELASRLLLPAKKMVELVPEPYIEAKLIKNIAKGAGVSEIVAALRIHKLSKRLRVEESVLAHVNGNEVVWKRRFNLNFADTEIVRLFKLTSQMPAHTNRLRSKAGRFYQASASVNPNYPFLFIHRLSDELAKKKPFHGITRKELENKLFSGNDRFRNILNGKISSCKKRVKGMEVEAAVSFMLEEYGNPEGWPDDCYSLFVSEECYKYLLLRLAAYV